MLENGANTSFVHQIADPDVPLEVLVADPLAQLPEPYAPDERIPLPPIVGGLSLAAGVVLLVAGAKRA